MQNCHYSTDNGNPTRPKNAIDKAKGQTTMRVIFDHATQAYLLSIFMDLARIESASNPKAPANLSPTTPGQITVAERALRELQSSWAQSLGIMVTITDKGYVVAHVPANLPREVAKPPRIGLLAHTDTSSDGKGPNGVKPRLVNCTGRDVVLENGTVIDVRHNPHLLELGGEQLVVTDGTSLLGGDNKAGMAEILAMLYWLSQHRWFYHAPLSIGFFPDEEIGRMADGLDLQNFDAAYAYTVDGGTRGEYNVETFIGVRATVEITGITTHPGEAKSKGMVNALEILGALLERLRHMQAVPQRTDEREPFMMSHGVNGTYGATKLDLLLRAFSMKEIQMLKRMLGRQLSAIRKEYQRAIIKVHYRVEYPNMIEYLRGHEHVIDRLVAAMHAAGITPLNIAVRGGTDGSRLSKEGVPTPNIFTGTMNMHGFTEHLVVPWANDASTTLIYLVGHGLN